MAVYDLDSLLNGKDLGNLGAAVAKAVEKHTEEARERLADELVAVIDAADREVQKQVCIVKTIREEEKVAKKRLEAIARTVQFLRETGNPLPYFKTLGDHYAGQDFCGRLGVAVPNDEDDLWSVPKDFAPSESE